MLAIVKSGDFKATKTDVVNTDVEEEGEEPGKPPEDPDVQEYNDFIGQDYFNGGTFDNEPDEDDPFGFSAIVFAQFQLGVKLADVCGVNASKEPKSVGMELAYVKSGRGG